jgi:CRP-like cAMP-binding protein
MHTSALRTNTNAFKFLIEFWTKHCELTKAHKDWALRHIHILQLKRGHRCYLEGDMHKTIYLVTSGALARVHITEAASAKDSEEGNKNVAGQKKKNAVKKNKRRISSIATPGMALMTTRHLFSNTPSKGEIVALHANTVILAIPYNAVRPFVAVDPCVTILNNMVLHKKKKQLGDLIYVLQSGEGTQRLETFREEMRELYDILSYQECADFIGISVPTVKRKASNPKKN